MVFGAMPEFLQGLGPQALIGAFPVLLKGTLITIEITLLSVAFGTLIGLLFGIMRLSKNNIVRTIAICYIDFFRGTPLLVQIFLITFGILPMFIKGVDPFIAAVIACSINSGAYVAEIVRGGIQSIDRGQTEAAQSLGMTNTQNMLYIILPQAFKIMIPPMINEFIAMMKDTSLVSVIAVEELTRKGQLQIAITYQAFWIWAGIAVMYLLLTIIISQIGRVIERRLAVE